ncbi:MAG TPA: RICIN domain-containing protein [Ktedonobacteraceae bacterium]|nr:RICIN domain-containing protein [Ktedonobacteraceae bacterium]
MQRFSRHLRTVICLTVLLSMVTLFNFPAAQAASYSHTTQARANATPTLVVNANQVLRSVTHVASGGLYGLGSDTTPNDSMVIPLHPKVFTQMAPGGHQLPNGATTPGGDALVVAPKAARAGAKVTIRMPDYYPNFPYKWVSWSNWLSVVDGQIAARKAATNVTNIYAWELWNEPDWTWDTTNAGSFNAGWVRTYQEVRSKDATTPILGPSISFYNASYMSSFLSYAKANNALPDIICWHELGGQGSIAGDISAYRSLEASLGISPRPIAIDEYATTSEVGIPGPLVGYIAKFERGGVDYANLAFWNQYGTFNDMVINNNQPNGAWWLYKWYGDMTGNMVVTTPPAQTGLDGAASVNSAGNQVSVILGGGSGSNAVTINGLNAFSVFGSNATVTLEYVASSGRTGVSPGTMVLSTTNYPISNGSITVPINNMNNTGAYHLLITPSSSGTAVYDKIVNKNSGLVLGIANASTSAGAQALQWSDNGTADHLWQLVDAGGGYVKIVNKNSGLVLGITNASTSAGAIALQWSDNGAADHLWQLVNAGGGYVKLVNKNSGLLLGITNASTSAGALALQWSDNGTADHLWQIHS